METFELFSRFIFILNVFCVVIWVYEIIHVVKKLKGENEEKRNKELGRIIFISTAVLLLTVINIITLFT